MAVAVHYSPARGRAGDVIPFFGAPAGQPPRFHVFYLKTPQDGAERALGGTAWHHLVSDDASTWTDLGEAIGRGEAMDQDASVATGSVIERDGLFHAFYTGFSPERKRAGLPEQGIMHATSTDLLSWRKDAAYVTLTAPADRYDTHDWRDPHVYFDQEEGNYSMLVAGQTRRGPVHRRGVIARYTSGDLVTWDPCEDLWAPHECPMHECPDLFRIGEWWYLVYSTFSDRQVTRYRMARTSSGPWLAPAEDALDDAGLYAGKSISGGRNRFLVGWCPTTTTGADDGEWQWGGSIVTHELTQRSDGTLGVRVPEQVIECAGVLHPTLLAPRLGSWTASGAMVETEMGDGFAWCDAGELPDQGSIRVRITASDRTLGIGLGLHVKGDLASGYLMRIRPGLCRVELDRFPRAAYAGVMHARPLPRRRGSYDVSLVWSGQTLVVAVGDTVLTARTHATGGHWGLFATEGHGSFDFRWPRDTAGEPA